MGLGFRRVEARELLAFLNERVAVRPRELPKRLELEDRLFRSDCDCPAAGDEAVDEEGRPDLGRENDLLAVRLWQDTNPFGGSMAEYRRVEPREEARRSVGVGDRP